MNRVESRPARARNRIVFSLMTAAAAFLSVPVSMAEEREQVTVFTTSYLPVAASQSVPETRYLLNVPDLLLQELGKQLPKTREAAQKELLRRIGSSEGQQLVARVEKGFNGVVLAWAHNIEHLPAILINDRYLVYGVYNVDEALAIYRERTQ